MQRNLDACFDASTGCKTDSITKSGMKFKLRGDGESISQISTLAPVRRAIRCGRSVSQRGPDRRLEIVSRMQRPGETGCDFQHCRYTRSTVSDEGQSPSLRRRRRRPQVFENMVRRTHHISAGSLRCIHPFPKPIKGPCLIYTRSPYGLPAAWSQSMLY